MKLSKSEHKLVKKYDTPETVVLVSSYPDVKGESAERNAIANYSRELVTKMSLVTPIVVIAEVLDRPKVYEENGVLVVRCYKRNSYMLLWQIISILKRFAYVRQVLMQFEFGVYGGSLVTFSLSALGLFVRGIDKYYTIMMHQVSDDLGELGEHLGIARKGVKTSIYNFGMKMFYRVVGTTATKIFVHNTYLKNKLTKYVTENKIMVVPHGVNVVRKINREKARAELKLKKNDVAILVFGYLSWYKGSDWVVRQIGLIQSKYPEKKIRLILAGGESGTLKNMPHYQEYIKKLKGLVNKMDGKITGYVADQDKSKYFVAADVVVLPHRVAMSESGVMAHVMAYGKPYLLSEARATSLDLSRAAPQVFGFDNSDEFETKLLNILEDKSLSNQIARDILLEGKARHWNIIALEYLDKLSGERKVAYTEARYAKAIV